VRRIVKALAARGERKDYSPRAFVQFPAPRGAVSAVDWKVEQVALSAFKACSWVYVCVTRLAQALSSVPWRVYTRPSRRNDWEVAEDHPHEVLLEYPNPRMSRKALMLFQGQQVLLRGNALFHRVAGANGESPELWPLNPARIQPIADEAQFLWGYKEQDGQRRELPAEEVAHAMLPDPTNPLWGVPPLRAISDVVAADIDAVVWNRSMLKNLAVPPGAFVDPSIVTDEQLAEARNRIRERYASPDNARTPMVLGGGASWVAMGQNAVEMDWIESRKFTVQEIVAAYNLLPAMFSNDAATYSNMSIAVRWMWENPVMQLLDAFEEAFNLLLVPPKDRATTWIHYDTSGVLALRDDLASRAAALPQLVASGVPVNEAARLLDLPLPSVSGGDTPLVSAGLMRLEDAADPLMPEE
jgi:HK97 family phage portal protein